MNNSETFSECEKKVLINCGLLKITKNKNVQKKTILKKFPQKYQEQGKKAIDSLLKRGYLAFYRKPDNLQVTPRGRNVTFKFAEEEKSNLYPDLNILFVV